METIDLSRTALVEPWGKCARCGHTLLVEHIYCPSCGKQRDYNEYVK